MKTITNCLAVAFLALVGSSCQNQQANNNTDSGYQEYGYYSSDSGSQQSSNPYATDSPYSNNQQPTSRDNDYVDVTPTTPQHSGGSAQMPAYQDTINPSPPQPASPSYGAVGSTSVALANTHTVSQGETLYRISKIYGSTVEGIKNVNGLDSNLIHPGEVLNIP